MTRTALSATVFSAVVSFATTFSAQAQVAYCPTGDGSPAAYQAAISCQRQNLAARRQQAADQAAQQQAFAAEQQRQQQSAYAAQQAAYNAQQRDMRARDEARRQAVREAALSQQRAEESPDNHCADTDFARSMIQELDNMQSRRSRPSTVVDVEHLTTTAYDAGRKLTVCHGIFVQSSGLRIPGTYTLKLNVAGDPIVSFSTDR